MASVEYPETGHDWCAAVEDDSWWFQHRNRVLIEVMRRFPPAAPLYDIGGGNGVVASALEEVGIRTVVVEPGAAGARRARERGLRAICATLEGAGLSAASVAAIGMFDVVEHIEDPDPFLRQAYELLRPTGRIYVTVPAYSALWSAEDAYAHHFRRYTKRSLGRALEEAGFEVELATYMFSFLPLPILLLRSLPYRLGRARPFSAKAVQNDHGVVSGPGRALLNRLLTLELGILRRTGTLPFGGSVVAVAKKTALMRPPPAR